MARVHRDTVRRIDPGQDRAVTVVARVVGDPRFAPLVDVDLRTLPAWRRYRGRG